MSFAVPVVEAKFTLLPELSHGRRGLSTGKYRPHIVIGPESQRIAIRKGNRLTENYLGVMFVGGPDSMEPGDAANVKPALENTALNSALNRSSFASNASNFSAGNFFRACAIISSDWSTPRICAPLPAISAVNAPVPQPKSRIRSPAFGASSSTNPFAISYTNACFASYWVASH